MNNAAAMTNAALLAAAVVLLAGCASAAPSPPPPRAVPITSTPDQEQLDEMARDAPCDNVHTFRDLAGPAQVADFGAVAVINCRQDARIYSGEGEWSVLLRQVATSGVAALVAALERPDEPAASADTVCALPGYGPLSILLADGVGGYLHPRMPETSCGGPQHEVSDAMDDLEWRTVSVTRLEQVRTPESIASGCSMSWKNLLEMLASSLKPSPGGPVFLDVTDTARKICIYHAGDDLDRGDFTRALTLDGADAQTFDAALSGAAPTGECDPQRDFAMVLSAGHWLDVELGGCWRVLRVDFSYTEFGGADAATVKRLLGID
jgi:hypothetical protein